MALPDSILRLCDSRFEPAKFVEMSGLRFASVGDNLTALRSEVFRERGNFVAAVEGLNGLFERNGDEQADNNSCYVNEETFPCVDWLVRGVNI
jgi:hypothetical protein